MGNNPSSFQNPAGPTFTLPTEAQWEYACRAGTTAPFCYGDGADTLGEYAWFPGNADGSTHAVGQLKPNAWGLCDMYGNVWEWCADWYAPDYYAHSRGIDPIGPPTGSTRMSRGGSWGAYSCASRSAFRRSFSPDYRYHTLGFRVVAVLVEESSRWDRAEPW